MSISMERFEIETVSLRPTIPFPAPSRRDGYFSAPVPLLRLSSPKKRFAPGSAPSARQSWERFARPGSILDNADRF